MPKAMNIRGIDEQVMRDFSSGAHARGITQAEYLRRLLAVRRAAAHAATYVDAPKNGISYLARQLDELDMFSEEV